MHRPRSVCLVLGASIALALCHSPESLRAQNGVRTIRDFPDQLVKEQKAEKVPRNGNRVRTAADFERAAAEEAARASQAAANAENQTGKKQPEEAPDTTQYAFSVPGADLVRVAAKAGASFAPQGGKLLKDGGYGAFQMRIHPGAMTSMSRGHIMTQLKPQDFWVIKSSKNRFLMFADAKGNPLPLRKGWSVQELILKGKNYKWITRPGRGAQSPFGVVEITAFHHANNVVEIAGAHLIGPPGVRNWEEAFVAPAAADIPENQVTKIPAATAPKQKGRRGVRASGL